MTQVIGCIDGSVATTAVCDYSAWASQRLSAPLLLLHVLDEKSFPVAPDLTGNIGLGSREHLLDELAELDAQRAKIALKHGHQMLEQAAERAKADGVEQVHLRQRHGDLADSLHDLEAETRLIVLGLHGADTSATPQLVGSHVETVIRTAKRPVLLTQAEFKQPQSMLFAFDGSQTCEKGVAMVAASPLFQSLPIHLVMVGPVSVGQRNQLQQAAEQLQQHGHQVTVAVLSGDVETALHDYQQQQELDVLVMGAYGHSRLRQFLLGSTTTHMLENATGPVLVLR